MAALTSSDLWVGAERRADGNPKQPGWWPAGYVTLTAKDTSSEVHLTPDAARTVAKRLKEFADVLDPPTPRVKKV